MNKQKTVDSKVLEILRECPETRYDDMQLMLRWVGKMNNIRACADEIVLNDIVYS